MAQQFKQSSDYNFTVEAAPSYMQLPDGSFVKDGFTVNRRTDNMAVLGKVTDRYGIVQNTDLIAAAEEAFSANGLVVSKRKIVVTGEGEKLYAVYDFDYNVVGLKVGDEVGLRLTVQNSFNGDLKASLLAGGKRKVCSNGLVLVEREIGMTQKHGSKVSVDFAKDAVVKALAAFDRSMALLNRLSEITITQAQGAIILENLEESNVLSGKVREGIAAIWEAPSYTEDHARNLLNLYNATTQYATHNVEGERFELAQRVSGGVLSAFQRVARNITSLAKLVTGKS